MLAVKERLDRGELVGILGDRTFSGERTVTCSFLGEPALFPEGPFLLAALLQVPVVLFFGLYQGDRRYAVHFELLADPIPFGYNRRSDEIRPWVEQYVRRLEHYCRLYPYNWFNFYALSPPDTRPAGAGPEFAAVRRTASRAVSRDGQPLDVPQLMELMAQVTSRQDTFTETKTVSMLTQPLILKGTLSYTRPDHVEKHVISPYEEHVVVDGDTLTLANKDGTKRVKVKSHPLIWSFVEAIRASLAGEVSTLRRFLSRETRRDPATLVVDITAPGSTGR